MVLGCEVWPVLSRLRAFLQSESLRTQKSGNLVTKAEPVPEDSPQVFGHIFSFFLLRPTAHRSPGTEVPSPYSNPPQHPPAYRGLPNSFLLETPSAGAKSQMRNSCGVRPVTQGHTEPRKLFLSCVYVWRHPSLLDLHPSLRASSDSLFHVPVPALQLWLGVCQELTVAGWRGDWTPTEAIRGKEGEQDFPVWVPACLVLVR